MYKIENITSDARQKQTFILPDGSRIQISLYFIEQQLGWFITSLVYGDFTLTNVRISNSPCMLYQFRNRIPFGLACFSDGDREPMLLNDFVSGASKLYILTEDEVNLYTEFLSGQV